jgi:hypothetical protein
MTRARLFFITATLLVVARGSDLAVTFYLNPSLSLETNPAISIFGGGSGSLIVVTTIFSTLAILSLVVFWQGRPLALHNPLPKSMTGFVRLWLKRVVFHRHPLFNYLPGKPHSNEGLQSIRLWGVSLSWGLIFGSFAAVYAWIAIWRGHSPLYRAAFAYTSVGQFSFLPTTTAVFGFLFGGLLFFVSEYLDVMKHKPGSLERKGPVIL